MYISRGRVLDYIGVDWENKKRKDWDYTQRDYSAEELNEFFANEE